MNMNGFVKFYNSNGPVVIVSILLWVWGAYNSFEFIEVIRPGTPLYIVFLMQLVLTLLQRNLYLPVPRKEVAILALVVDTLLNVGGLFFFMQNVASTDTWAAIATTFGLSAPSNVMVFVLSVILGIMIAVGPEMSLRYGTIGTVASARGQ